MTTTQSAAQNIDEAITTLQSSGRVTLAGKPARWSSGTLVLLIVLLVLIGIVAAGVAVTLTYLIATGFPMFPATIFGVVGVSAMIIIGFLLVLRGIRSQRQHRQTELGDITIESSGLTLRGVGPVPWHDFGIAEHRMVPAERDSGYVRRAVMQLTPSGLVNVNKRLPQELRNRLSPQRGPIWNRRHECIYVPAAEGLGQREVMHLINVARDMFSAPPRA